MTTVTDALQQRVRKSGSGPLLTYYDLDSGERTELSGVSFANWVDKAAHLFAEHDVSPGEVVAHPLAKYHPGHWVSLITVMAAWQLGASVVPDDDPSAAITVIGPGHSLLRWGDLPAGGVVACSLDPLARPFETLRPDISDFGAEVFGQPDDHMSLPAIGGDVAWLDERRRATFDDLAAVAPSSGRHLVRVGMPGMDDSFAVVRDALVAPLLGGGSTVVVSGSDARDFDRIVSSEKIN